MTQICLFTNLNYNYFNYLHYSVNKIIYSLINNTEDVTKDTTREEVPLQSIFLEHNI